MPEEEPPSPELKKGLVSETRPRYALLVAKRHGVGQHILARLHDEGRQVPRLRAPARRRRAPQRDDRAMQASRQPEPGGDAAALARAALVLLLLSIFLNTAAIISCRAGGGSVRP